MNKTIALRTELNRLFKTITTNVYHEDKPDNAGYPYLVYESSELTYEYGKTQYQLEVNIVDHGEDSSVVENLSDSTQAALNKYYFINPYIEFTVYKGQRLTVKEEDKQIIRRRMLFEIQLHELKGE